MNKPTKVTISLRVCLVLEQEGWDESIPICCDGMVPSLSLVGGWGWGWGRPCSLFGWRDEDETGYVAIGDMFDIHFGGAYVSSSLAHHLPPSTTPTAPWSPSQASHLPQPPITSPAPALSSTPPSPSHNVDFALVRISPGAR